jgi:CRP-like cAMP-binding protein
MLLFAEGEPGEELFIIKSGSVRITKIVNESEVILAILKPGDMFGEMAILESKPRSANAIAHEDCSVLVVKKENFEYIAASQPQVITRLTTTLADRIWFIYKQIANALVADPLGRVYDAMLMHLEKNRVPLDVKAPYIFNFRLEDFLNMAGISAEDTNTISGALLKDKKLQISDDKIEVTDVTEIVKESEYYRKMQQREQHRRESHLTQSATAAFH